MNYRVFRSDFWRSLSLVEFGFLWSVFFAAWGPVPRYFGWLLAIIGLCFKRYRGESWSGKLYPFVRTALLFILLWGLPATIFRKPDLFHFLKGYSLVLEFAFSIWLAAKVYSEESLRRFLAVFYASTLLAIIYTLAAFLWSNHFAGPFRNINTLGGYGVILLPFSLSWAFEEGGILSWLLSVGVLFAIFISSSLAAWLTALFCLLLLAAIGGKRFLRGGVQVLLLFSLLFAGMWAGLGIVNPRLEASLADHTHREFNQFLSFDDPARFTTNRSFIWQGSVNLVRKYPLSGWGWGSFNDPFVGINKSWWDPKRTGLDVQEVGDAHNMYLNLSVYGGIPTAVAVVALFLFSAYRALIISKEKGGRRWFWIAVSVSILSHLFLGLAGDVFSDRFKFACIFWYFLGFTGRVERE